MARSKDYVVSNGASNFERFVRICCLVRTRLSKQCAGFNGKFATLLTVACVERDV